MHHHAGLSPLGVVERLRCVHARGQRAPQLDVAAPRRADERARSAGAQLPEHPAQRRSAGERVRARVRPHREPEPRRGSDAEQGGAFHEVVTRPAGSFRVERPLHVAQGELEPSQGQGALPAQRGARQLVSAADPGAHDGDSRGGDEPLSLTARGAGGEGRESHAQRRESHRTLGLMAGGSPAWTARWTSSRRPPFSAFAAATLCCHRARRAWFAWMFAASGRPGRCSTYPTAPAKPTVPATMRRDPLGRSPPTTEGKAATVVASSRPPSSARNAGRLSERSGKKTAVAGGFGHGSVSTCTIRTSRGSWMMPVNSPVGAREATRNSTRLTGGSWPAASRPSHCTCRLSPMGPAYNVRNGAPS